MPPPRRRRSRSARAAVVVVHLYGRPAELPDLGLPVIEDAAHAHGALDGTRRRRDRVLVLSDQEPGRDRRRRRRRDRRRGARRPGPEPAVARPRGRRSVRRDGDELAPLRARGRRASHRPAAGSRTATGAGPRSRPPTGRRAPAFAGSPTTPATPTISASPGCPTGTASAPRCRSRPPCTTRERSPPSRHTPAFAATPRRPPTPGRRECVSFPCYPELTDEEVERVCAALALTDETSISACLLCYNDAETIAGLVARAGEALDELGTEGEIVVVDDGSSDASARAAA